MVGSSHGCPCPRGDTCLRAVSSHFLVRHTNAQRCHRGYRQTFACPLLLCPLAGVEKDHQNCTVWLPGAAPSHALRHTLSVTVRGPEWAPCPVSCSRFHQGSDFAYVTCYLPSPYPGRGDRLGGPGVVLRTGSPHPRVSSPQRCSIYLPWTHLKTMTSTPALIPHKGGVDNCALEILLYYYR